MQATIDRFAKSRLIDRDEVSTASEAEAAGVASHTIGYEVEVLPSALPDISKFTDQDDIDDFHLKCGKRLEKYGYDVGCDGVYELQSPAASHSYPLAVATRGLARFGWLPKRGTKGLVTSHVSIGTSERIDKGNHVEIQAELITILRAIEMHGGTTPNRLDLPARLATAANWSTAYAGWNQKGRFGVKILPHHYMNMDGINWRGENNRIEFRTLGYYSPKQYGAMLDAVYYLTRGMFSDDDAVVDIYEDYRDWLDDYFDRKGLPQVNMEYDHASPTVLRHYMGPYADHLANDDLTTVRSKTAGTIRDLREEFNMTHIPLDDDHLVSAGLPFSN